MTTCDAPGAYLQFPLAKDMGPGLGTGSDELTQRRLPRLVSAFGAHGHLP